MSAQHERATRVRFLVLATLCAAAAIAYVQRNGLGVAVPFVMGELQISSVQMGAAMSSFFIPYALVQVPAARLATLWRTRRALTMFAVLWSMATAAIAIAPNWYVLMAAQIAMGAAQAGLFPAATLTLVAWLPAHRRGMASGALASCMSVGAASGAALAGWLLEWTTWRVMFVLYALPGVLWAAWFSFWFRNSPAEHRQVNEEELNLIRRGQPDQSAEQNQGDEPTPWATLLTSRAMWCICAQHVFRSAGYIFYPTWYPSYLREARGVSVLESGLLTSLPLAAVVLGSPLGGVASDWVLHRTGSVRLGRQVFAAVCMVLSAVMILAAWQIRSTTMAAAVIAGGSFFAALGGPCAYAITMDLGGRHVAAVFSTMNSVGAAGAFAFPFIVPWILRASNWDTVLLLFAGIYLAAAACWLGFRARGAIA